MSTWQQLKVNLRRNLINQRDESCLTIDLVLVKQNSNNLNYFDLQLAPFLSSCINYHEITNNEKSGKHSKWVKKNHLLQLFAQCVHLIWTKPYKLLLFRRKYTLSSRFYHITSKTTWILKYHNYHFQAPQWKQSGSFNQFLSQPIPVRLWTDFLHAEFPEHVQFFHKQS